MVFSPETITQPLKAMEFVYLTVWPPAIDTVLTQPNNWDLNIDLSCFETHFFNTTLQLDMLNSIYFLNI